MPPVVQTFRNAELSLWQAVVADALPDAPVLATARIGVGDAFRRLSHPFVRAAEHAGAIIESMGRLGHDVLATLVPSLKHLPPPEAVQADFTRFGLLVIGLARIAGDDPAAFKALLTTRYADLDPGWVEYAVNYFVCVRLARRGIIGYRGYQNLGQYVYDDKLPEKACVALVGDWGTGTQEAEDLLRLVAAKNPDVVIHLGDVYYAGTRKEYAVVRKQCQDVLRTGAGGPPVFTLAGNHDLYSGGDAYYEAIDALGQEASYFCLRNANWQFVAMDTGLKNSAVALGWPVAPEPAPNGLDPREAEWVKDKVANAGGRQTILLSHHQPFSAFERLTSGGPVNVELLGQMRPVLDRVNRWYWGHEHDLVIYLDEEKYQGVLGRCVGHAAIPMPVATYRQEAVRPQTTADFAVPKVADVPLDVMSGNPIFYNHGYVLINLDGPKGTATHYQTSEPEKVLLTEVLA